ncbi:uncharacterized protein BDZ99DRAFT_476881 [Mytilinidion resinicola]|uniref:Uncharacterized protein n=1 Tax=Mytilinidion resinicola TaxID=574789 RepID=A0A6A6YNB1_9PEZI|nr:uncharacterized protein BDZ99DRAFT_476881 [Mytilinidion resinicola]KAF2809455.1 hypothetical protein BDZ99DRAFT_476881 [Mytilinidion resinicola]
MLACHKLALNARTHAPLYFDTTGKRLTLQETTDSRVEEGGNLERRPEGGKMVTTNHIYYLPRFESVPLDSVIHQQVVGNRGFFNHPVLVIEFAETPNVVRFLPLTTFRGIYGTGPTPSDIRLEYIAIQDLNSPPDDEVKVQVTPESPQMDGRTWIKMEVFRIEAFNLQQYRWKTIEIDANGMNIIWTRLRQLDIAPGAVMQVPDETSIGTDSILHTQIGDEREGYSILNHLAVVVEISDEFARILPTTTKDVSQTGIQKGAQARAFRQQYLLISNTAVVGHDGTPVLNLDRISSPLSQNVYVKTGKSYWIEIGRLKYYQFPSVRLDPLSARVLLNYHFPLIHDRTLSLYLGRAPSPHLEPLPADLPRDLSGTAPISQHREGPQQPQTPASAAPREPQNPFLPVYPPDPASIQRVAQQEEVQNPYRPVFPAGEVEAPNPYRPVFPD